MNPANYIEVFQAISSFYSSKTYALLLRRLNTIPFIEAIGKGRSETSHSAFLQWLFNATEFNNLVSFPVKSLLRLLALKSWGTPELMDKALCTSILTDSININFIRAEIEQSTKSEYGDGRSDIEIKGSFDYAKKPGNTQSFRIVIENKIDSKEGKNQCKKYYEYYSHLDNINYTIYVYLSPIEPTELSSPHFITITYQDLLNNVLNPLLHDKTNLSDRALTYLNMFVENITSLRTNKSKIQLAMDTELKELLKDFYNNNEELILAAIDAAAPDEIRSKVREIRGGKDFSSYRLTYMVNGTLRYKQVTAKSKLAKTFVEIFLEINPNASLSDIQAILNPIKKNVISNNDRSRAYQIEGKDWYIDSGIWGKGSNYFDELLRVIKNQSIDCKPM